MKLNLILILSIISLIILASCNKTDNNKTANNELTALNEPIKEDKKSEPSDKPEDPVRKTGDLGWHDCAKSFDREKLIEICNSDFIGATFYESSKSCQINLGSSKLNSRIFIEIENYNSNSEAKEKYDFVVKTDGRKNNATVQGAIARWQELIRGRTPEGEAGKGILRDRVEMYKGKKEVEINIVPANGCKDTDKLIKTVFALI